MRALLTRIRLAFRSEARRREDVFFERQRAAARESGWLL